MIKFHVVEEAKEAGLYFVQNFLGELLTAKYIDLSLLSNRLRYIFQRRNEMRLLSVQSGVRLIEVLNNRN